jgi:hypothetical protein
MSRIVAAAALAALLGTAAARPPVAAPPAGSWKLTVRNGQTPILLLLALSQAEGKWVGDVVDATAQFKSEPKFADVAVAGDAVRFTLTVEGRPLVSFDGVLAKDGKLIRGSVSQGGGPLELTELRPSTLKKLTDPFELMRESLAQTDDAQPAFEAAVAVLGQAAAKKMSPDEARGIVDKVTKLAAAHGPRWERSVSLRLAGLLADQPGFADVALAQARRAERMLTDADDATARMEVLETLVRALTKANKGDEAKGYQTQVARLEARDYAEYAKSSPPFKVEPYPGRRAKGDRVALVELFTNTELAPLAAFDVAADGLRKAYKPADVVVLTYHLPVRDGGDPLTPLDIRDRLEAYVQGVQRGRFGIVCGKPAVGTQEGADAAKGVYDALRERIDAELERPAGSKLSLAVTPAGKGFNGKATVTDLEKPGDGVFLRFALAEERVRYAGGNGVRYHHNVVRSLPGGKGFPVKGKAGDATVTIDPAELREKLAKSLDEYQKEGAEFSRPDRPLVLTNLKLVAFVQNDATGEVLTAAQADVPAK